MVIAHLSDVTPIKPSPKKRKPSRAPRKKRVQSASTTDHARDRPTVDEDAPLKRAPKRKRPPSPARRPPAQKRAAPSGPPEIAGVEPATVTEVEGFLVETLALSRSSSMSTTQLVTAVLAEQSHLRSRRSEEEWTDVFAQVLGACDVFGRLRRTGKDANGKPIEEQWYYQPEHDSNVDRASLLKDLVRSKRSAAKKEDVQYYWRPIPKTQW